MMARIIGVLNYKGGTGKTTTVVNLAVGLAMRGARILCVDLDPQGSLAAWFGINYQRSLSDLLLGQADPLACINPVRDNLDLIASDNSLLQAEKTLWRMHDDQSARRLISSKLHPITTETNKYDYVILDYSPSVSLLSESGLCYVQELIVPVAMNYLALIGTRQVIQTLQKINELPEQNLQLSWIIPQLYYERLRKDREIISLLHQYFPGKVTLPIRSNVKLSEAASHQTSIYEYAPKSYGAIDYANLVEVVAGTNVTSHMTNGAVTQPEVA